MSVFAPLYGRLGQQADGDPQVAELLARTVSGQVQATSVMDDLIAELQSSGKTPWTTAIPNMAVAHSRWLAAMLWQMATCYLDGNVEMHSAAAALPAEVYRECDDLCDQADAMTLRSIQLQSGLDHGVRPTNAEMAPFPKLNAEGLGYAGVWQALEAVLLQVRSDLRVIELAGVSKPMQSVSQKVHASYQPVADQFVYLQSSWKTATSEENRRELVRTALALTQQLFVLGQQIWAPYLLGQVYVEALRYKPTLEDLGVSDPWVLTDPRQKEARKGNPTNQQELTEFWTKLADPAAAVQLHQQLQDAVQARRIRMRTGHGYQTTPWPAQYLVRYPVTFGARTFHSGDLIALYVDPSAEQWQVEVRKTGRLTNLLDLLGQAG